MTYFYLLLLPGPLALGFSVWLAGRAKQPVTEFLARSCYSSFWVKSPKYIVGFLAILLCLYWVPFWGFYLFGKTDGNVLVTIVALLAYYYAFRIIAGWVEIDENQGTPAANHNSTESAEIRTDYP